MHLHKRMNKISVSLNSGEKSKLQNMGFVWPSAFLPLVLYTACLLSGMWNALVQTFFGLSPVGTPRECSPTHYLIHLLYPPYSLISCLALYLCRVISAIQNYIIYLRMHIFLIVGLSYKSENTTRVGTLTVLFTAASPGPRRVGGRRT